MLGTLRRQVPNYEALVSKLARTRALLGEQKLTLAEKILYTHLCETEETLGGVDARSDIRGKKYLKLRPDRVAMQDASAQMALLQFMATGLSETAVPASIHCDHLVVGQRGEQLDLARAHLNNDEVFKFLESCSKRYGIQFWPPGSGIIHQLVLENFACPGLLMLGTDSHTPNAGGLGALAIGVGGADAVDALTGTPWELKAPRVLGIELRGRLSEWCSPKDVITHLAGLLTVRGGTGYIIEYFGEGVKTLSCTGMATICNMGAEIGATTSLFPYQDAHRRYLKSTGRELWVNDADSAMESSSHLGGLLNADPGAEYDEYINLDLASLKPKINGPFTPDLSTPLSDYGTKVRENNWPQKISAGLIGSCTNSSYEDMTRVVSLIKQAAKVGLKPKIPFFVSPGSEQIRATLEKNGILQVMRDNGALVLSNACGPCIGQWDREDIKRDSNQINSIFTSFNRNFRARNDGNPNTMNFLTSPEIVTSMIYSGDANFNPVEDSLITPEGKEFKFSPPNGEELPSQGFQHGRDVFYPETNSSRPDPDVSINVSPDSERLQLLEPFAPWDGKELQTTTILKVKGKCTTDHISAAGVWLKYKGHLENISYNTLIGAQNEETGEVNVALDLDGTKNSIPDLMMKWKNEGRPWNVLAEHNYGEGSAREHAALSPRFLGGRMILVKSFARIHETNLKKQGILPLTFANEADYDKIHSGDILETLNLREMISKNGDNGGIIRIGVTKPSGEKFSIITNHTMSQDQIAFFIAGSAINHIGNSKVQN